MARQGLTIPITVKDYNEAMAQLKALSSTIVDNNDATDEQIATQKELKKVLDANGIAIPFPQLVVHQATQKKE